LDQGHLKISGATETKIAVRAFLESMALGSLDLGSKLGLVVAVSVAFAVWVAIPLFSAKRAVTRTVAPKQTVEEILTSHPSWNRERLEYVQREKWKESEIR